MANKRGCVRDTIHDELFETTYVVEGVYHESRIKGLIKTVLAPGPRQESLKQYDPLTIRGMVLVLTKLLREKQATGVDLYASLPTSIRGRQLSRLDRIHMVQAAVAQLHITKEEADQIRNGVFNSTAIPV